MPDRAVLAVTPWNDSPYRADGPNAGGTAMQQQPGSFMSSLDGRVAFVTGAASGIGRSIALELGRWGARVAVADLDAAGAVETVAQLAGQRVTTTDAGGSALAVPLDVA